MHGEACADTLTFPGSVDFEKGREREPQALTAISWKRDLQARYFQAASNDSDIIAIRIQPLSANAYSDKAAYHLREASAVR